MSVFLYTQTQMHYVADNLKRIKLPGYVKSIFHIAHNTKIQRSSQQDKTLIHYIHIAIDTYN